MKLVFVHDHVFLKYKDEYYTSGSLTSEVMQRYINVFGNITLVTRGKEVKKIKTGLDPSSVKGTQFVAVPNYKAISKVHNIIKAKKIVEREVLNADFIIVRSSSLGNIAVKYAKKHNKPYLIEVVGCAWDASWNYNLIGKLLAPFSYYMQKKTVKNAPYAVYVTNKFLQQRYPTKGKHANCSNVALTRFEESVLTRRLQKISSMSELKPIIIGTTAAVDVRYKGQEYVIEALGKLKKQGITNYEYHLVGGGDQSYLKSLAQQCGVVEQVAFAGSLPHDKVFEWLETIDIYAQPSRQEGLPRALIEAMSRGLPAFGARTAGIPELLDEKFIFSNTRHNIDEICSILESMTQEVMLHQAKRNYEESRKYDKEIIDGRRQKFFKDFLEDFKK